MNDAKTDAWDSTELMAVRAALQKFDDRCQEILALLQGNPGVGQTEQLALIRAYGTLKRDLAAAAKYGTLSGERALRTEAEECFYRPALRQAFARLKPRRNSDPNNAGWVSALSAARAELSYWQHKLINAQKPFARF